MQNKQNSWRKSRPVNVFKKNDFASLWITLRAAGSQSNLISPEAEFLDEIQTKDLRVFLLAIHSHLNSFA